MTSKNALPETIRTARLVLIEPNATHLGAIATLANNRKVHDKMARLPFPYTLQDARFFLEQIVPSDDERCYAIMADSDTFTGVVGLHFASGLAPELGYWLGEPYWGHGFATEAGMAVVAAARTAGFSSLRSRALVHNTGSRNVLRKLGFAEIGEAVEQEQNLKGKMMTLMRLEFV